MVERQQAKRIPYRRIDRDLGGGFGGLYPFSGRQSHVGSLTLTVHERFRGKGIGAGMLELLLTTADVWAGLRRVQLHVFADNHDALSLYEAFGFRSEGLHEALVQTFDSFVDVHTMALNLASDPRAARRRGPRAD